MERGEGKELCRTDCLAEMAFSGVLADKGSRAIPPGVGTHKVRTGAFEESVVVWEDVR